MPLFKILRSNLGFFKLSLKNLKARVINRFLYSSGVLLVVTAAAKFISADGFARILKTPDPLLGISFGIIFGIVGGIEILVALFCFLGKRPVLQNGLVAWLATNFVVYRLGLMWIGYHRPCSCLGNLTDALHISPETADTAMKVVLGYLLVGSYASLFWLWRQNRKPDLATPRAGSVTPATS